MFSVRRTQGASFLALSEDGLRYQAITLVTFRLRCAVKELVMQVPTHLEPCQQSQPVSAQTRL